MALWAIFHDNITPGMSRKSAFGAQNHVFGLFEASRGLISCKAIIEQLCSPNPFRYAISVVGVAYSRWGHNFEFLAVEMAKNSHFWLSEASRGL